MNSLTARTRFKLRPLSNYAGALAVFIPLAVIFSQFQYGWVADIVAIAVLYYLCFFVWENRPIWMRCSQCRKLIATNTPWVCGFCKKENRKIDEFPFAHRCEHCGAEPKAYQCHHDGCRKLIFLTEDQLSENYAYCLNLKTEPLPVDIGLKRSEEKQALEHEILVTTLQAKLNEGKRRLELEQKKSPYESKAESLDRHKAEKLAVYALADEEKALNASAYANNPEMLKRANEVVDDWIRNEI